MFAHERNAQGEKPTTLTARQTALSVPIVGAAGGTVA